MVDTDVFVVPFIGFVICQSLACGFMYSKMRRRIRELESLVGEGSEAHEAPVPSAPADFVVVPVGMGNPQNQYLGGVTFTQMQAQLPPRHW